MIDQTSNLLGAVGLAVSDRIEHAALEVLHHAGETPAALVVIGYGLGPSNDQLRRVLGLSHPGTVRLVDRLVADGLVERRQGDDKRAVALYTTKKGQQMRRSLLEERMSALKDLVLPLSVKEQTVLAELLRKMLKAMAVCDADRRRLCRLCDDSACTDCPIPANSRSQREE